MKIASKCPSNIADQCLFVVLLATVAATAATSRLGIVVAVVAGAFLHRALLVGGNLDGALQRQRLHLLLAQAIQHGRRLQPTDEPVQQNVIELLAKLAVDRQLLDASEPIGHRFVRLLLGIVEDEALPQHRRFLGELLVQQLEQLGVRLLLWQCRMADVAQRLVVVFADADEEDGSLLFVRDVVHVEKLLQTLSIHGPIARAAVEIRHITECGHFVRECASFVRVTHKKSKTEVAFYFWGELGTNWVSWSG